MAHTDRAGYAGNGYCCIPWVDVDIGTGDRTHVVRGVAAIAGDDCDDKGSSTGESVGAARCSESHRGQVARGGAETYVVDDGCAETH